MRVEAAKQVASGPSNDFADAFGRAVEREGAAPVSESRALVVIDPAAAIQTAPIYREATFLAHLIATREHAPQTRERRRAQPAEAIAAYRRALARL